MMTRRLSETSCSGGMSEWVKGERRQSEEIRMFAGIILFASIFIMWLIKVLLYIYWPKNLQVKEAV
jgi:hypothetical protein